MSHLPQSGKSAGKPLTTDEIPPLSAFQTIYRSMSANGTGKRAASTSADPREMSTRVTGASRSGLRNRRTVSQGRVAPFHQKKSTRHHGDQIDSYVGNGSLTVQSGYELHSESWCAE